MTSAHRGGSRAETAALTSAKPTAALPVKESRETPKESPPIQIVPVSGVVPTVQNAQPAVLNPVKDDGSVPVVAMPEDSVIQPAESPSVIARKNHRVTVVAATGSFLPAEAIPTGTNHGPGNRAAADLQRVIRAGNLVIVPAATVITTNVRPVRKNAISAVVVTAQKDPNARDAQKEAPQTPKEDPTRPVKTTGREPSNPAAGANFRAMEKTKLGAKVEEDRKEYPIPTIVVLPIAAAPPREVVVTHATALPLTTKPVSARKRNVRKVAASARNAQSEVDPAMRRKDGLRVLTNPKIPLPTTSSEYRSLPGDRRSEEERKRKSLKAPIRAFA